MGCAHIRHAWLSKAGERLGENHRRLRLTRNVYGHIPIRVMVQVPLRPGHAYWGSLLGETLRIQLPEAVDVWQLWADVKRFIRAWRPNRIRSAQACERVEAIWSEFERLANSGDF